MKHFLAISSINKDEMHRLYRLAHRLEDVVAGKKSLNVLEGAVLANLFFEPSTRTRMSFHSAFMRLGGKVITLDDVGTSSFVKGESVEDAAKVISQYCDITVMRHSSHDFMKRYASASSVSVINGGSGAEEHPTQALLDVYTIHKELSSLSYKGAGEGSVLDFEAIHGSTIAFCGDLKYGRTVHSLIKALSLYRDMTFVCFAPLFLQIPSNIKEYALARGHTFIETEDPTALAGARVLYTTRLQKERHESGVLAFYDFEKFHINKAFIVRYLSEDIIILHPLPRDERQESYDLATDVDDMPGFSVFRQAGYGVPVRMALFLDRLGMDEDLVLQHMHSVLWRR